MPIAPNVACAAKVSQIVREEMNATGAQVSAATATPASYGANPVAGIPTPKLRALCSQGKAGLGPTHEEITTIARDMIRSYRQLPLHSTKFKPSSGMKFDPGLA